MLTNYANIVLKPDQVDLDELIRLTESCSDDPHVKSLNTLIFAIRRSVNDTTNRYGEKNDPFLERIKNEMHIRKLNYAIRNNDLDVFSEILNKLKANSLNIPEYTVHSTGRIPICVAAYHGRLNMLKELINAGASINATDTNGNNPLIPFAARHIHVLEYLLSVVPKENINHADEYGTNAVQHAVNLMEDINGNVLPNYEKNQECIDVILLLNRYGCDINHRNKFGRTALMNASHQAAHPVISALVSCGADASILCNNNKRAIDYASCPTVKLKIEKLG